MIDYAREYHACPKEGHGFRIKDERGCWMCLEELRQQEKVEEKAAQPRRIYKIPPVSKKQAKLNREISKSRGEVMEAGVCSGCGRREGGVVVLEDSHLISRDYCQKYSRMDLYADVRNRKPHCRTWLGHEGCHSKWESNAKRHTLLDYRANMAFIKSEIPQLAKVMLMNEAEAKMKATSKLKTLTA